MRMRGSSAVKAKTVRAESQATTTPNATTASAMTTNWV